MEVSRGKKDSPKTGSYFPAFLEPRWAVEKALTAVTQDALVTGVSTNSVKERVKAIGMGSGRGCPVDHVIGTFR